MGVNYFYAAWDKSTTLTKNFPPMLYVFDFQYLLGGQSELKILVSVVRFRLGPPRNTKTTFGWFSARKPQKVIAYLHLSR